MVTPKKEKIKLGAMLLQENIITEEQLDEALKAQVIFGGRLGTNLIELGYLDEEALAYFLSEKIGIPYAHPKTLLDIKQDVLDLVPTEIASRYKVLPLEVKKKRLSLVMYDPQDYEAINEISFITGHIIEPMVTPELRLVQALEVHYSIDREHRHIPFRDNLKYGREEVQPEESIQRPVRTTRRVVPAENPATPAEKPATPAEPPPDQDSAVGATRRVASTVTADHALKRDSAYSEDGELSEELILQKVQKLKEKRKSMLARKARQLKEKEEETKPAPTIDHALKRDLNRQSTIGNRQLEELTPHEILSKNLKTALTRNAVGKLLLDYIVNRFPLGVILAVKGDTAYGWCAAGSNYCEEYVQKLRIPLSVPSLLKQATEEGFVFHAGEDHDPMDKMMRRVLRVEDSLGIAVATIFYQQVVVCFLLAVGPSEIFNDQTNEELKRAAKNAGDAFGRLIQMYKKEAT